MKEQLKIGDTLYTRDTNRRRYVESEGRRVVDPAYYWCEHTIIGETRQSWLLSGDYKVDKATMRLRVRGPYGLDLRVYTPAEKEDHLWREQHARAVIRLVEYADTPTLRQIAALLGYEGD